MTPKKSKGLITYLLLIVIAVFCLVFISSRLNADAEKTEYTTVISYFDQKKVSEYTLDLGTGDLTYKLQGDDAEKHYTVPNVNIFLEDTENYRQEYNKANPDAPLVQDYIKITDRTWLYSLIPVLLTIILGIAILYFMMKQSGGGGKYTTFGKANLKNGASARKATFKDVAGADEEKQELVEIVDYLKNPKKYTELGAKVPKGVLLLGPPGTGKTLLARAVAGEAGCPFFPISGSDFVEMDGFTGNESVIVIAATNRRDILDPALLRPGRFDRQIVVGYPDVKGREEILRVHAKNKPLGPDVDIKRIARTTQGFTGADLENVLNEAALLAARNERRAITEADIEEATLKVIAGPEKKSRIVTEHDRKVTAYHEAGHAVASYNLPTQDKVHQVTIIQRGMAAGLTIYRPDTDDQHVSRNQMRERIISLLGGRCAEEIFLDDICTGASNDIERATATARNMVTKYGFSSKLGTVTYGSDNDEVFLGKDYGHTKNYSESVAAQIDEEVRSIIEKAYSDCVEILRANADKMHFLAKYLLKYEKIDGDDFEKLMKGEISEDVLSDDEVGAPLGLGDTPEPELN